MDGKYLHKYTKLLFSTFKDIFLNSLYYISKIVPKRKKLWVFGSSRGLMFKDNSKYLFLFLQKYYKKDIKSIWISKNKSLISELRNNKYPVFHKWSLKGIYYTLRAKVIIQSHGEGDVNLYLASGIRVNLWHGAPLKKIGFKNLNSDNFIYRVYYSKGWRRIFYKLTWPSIFRKIDYLLATSDFYKKIFSEDFEIEERKIIVDGYPRNDILFESVEGMEIDVDQRLLERIRSEKRKGKTILMYMPTFRDSAKLLLEDIFDFPLLNKRLSELNFYLVLKIHSSTMKAGEDKTSEHIGLCKSQSDSQPILSETDVLITDYSSVYFDFLLLNKPIIFYAYDLDDYLLKERKMYFNYEDITPGKIVKTFSELLEALQEISNNEYNYSQELEELKEKIFKYSDNHSSQRITNFIANKLVNVKINKKGGNS